MSCCKLWVHWSGSLLSSNQPPTHPPTSSPGAVKEYRKTPNTYHTGKHFPERLGQIVRL